MKTWIFTLSTLCFLTSPFWSGQTRAQVLYGSTYPNSSRIYNCNPWFFTGGVGGSFPIVTNDNYVNPGPGWPNDHFFHDNADSVAVGMVGAGYAWKRLGQTALPYVSLGANFYYAGPGDTNGQIEQYSLPQFLNYNYKYKIQRQSLMGVVKADLWRYCNWMPYLTAGVGVSWNKFSGYEEFPLSHVTPRISPGFSESTSTYFAWMVGAGIDYVIQDNLWVSLDYTYGSYGYVKSGRGYNTETLTGYNYSDARLKNKLSANNVMLSFTSSLNYLS